ncbi:MAG: phospholipid carrier-dependent glycosyltransferase, partial [Desulfobacterales bacterium]|nr:phospholipid carrier-dependent glycosyltransferase [Desulfobacterales bacterium]
MRDIIPKTLPFLLLASLMILVLLIVAMASVPPVSRDALTHHLAVPRLYLEHGGIYETPDIIAAYNPMNLDLLYVLPLLWANDIAPKYIHFLFALATGVLIYGHLRRRLSPSYGMIAVLLFLSLPVIIKLSITVYVDLGLVFFSTAALLGLVKWKESNWQTRYLLLAALCCGLALGTKYNGLVVLMLMSFFV